MSGVREENPREEKQLLGNHDQRDRCMTQNPVAIFGLVRHTKNGFKPTDGFGANATKRMLHH